MSSFCVDLSLNLSTLTVSRVQAKCLHKPLCAVGHAILNLDVAESGRT